MKLFTRQCCMAGTLCAMALSGLLDSAARAQSAELRDIFEQAAAAVKMSAVTQPLGEEAKPNGTSAPVVPPTPGGETLPPPRFEGKLPLAGDASGEVELTTTEDGRITLLVRDASLSRVLALLAQTQKLNIVSANDIDALISITLRDVPMEEALTAILSVANYTWVDHNGIILVTSLSSGASLPAGVQGRQIEVFDLDFVSATSVAEAVTGFLSPIGKVTVHTSDSTNSRLAQERIVVEDLPASLARIADFICEIDQPPRQVLIEAHILQINLRDENDHGENLRLRTAGFASATASPAFVATLEGGDLGCVIELLQTTTDSKTLGAPKILVLNEQAAVVHVGESIGYQTSTTTELSVNQAPQFLDVGVKLTLIPRITRDGRVLLHVTPDVSTGEFDPISEAPNKRTTMLETDVMLRDGQGMVIGGLIRETDTVTQSKVPYLGDVKGLGWFFRNSKVTKERVEIIFALVPRIQPYAPEWQEFEQGELVKAGVPLFHGPLCRTNRPWDAILPDGKRRYRTLNPKRPLRQWPQGQFSDLKSRYTVPPKPLPEQYFYGEGCDVPPSVWSPQNGPELMQIEESLPGPQSQGWSSDDEDIFSDQPR
jgi:type IV pilus assembly protein PilQ